MTIGQKVQEARRWTAELRSWQRQGDGYYGTVWNDVNKIIADGSEHCILQSAVKYVQDNEDHYLVVTRGWRWKLLKSQEIVLK